MTTVAYRDGILAADRQMSQSSAVHACDCKIAVILELDQNDVAFAYAGHATLGLAFMEWVRLGSKPGEFPATFGEKDYFYGLLVRPVFGKDAKPAKPCIQYWDSSLFPLDETDNPYSCQGAGASIAYGAFHAGATAIGAIRAANYHCADSGFGISYIDMNAEGGLEVKRATSADK